MQKINIGLIGYGNVGQGVVKILNRNHARYKKQYNVDFIIKKVCDRSIDKKNTKFLGSAERTKDIDKVINDPAIDVVIELIGGMSPAKRLTVEALKNGKHIITANKLLIANCANQLFDIAMKHKRHLYYESAVMAGIPIIKTISEGLAGNTYDSIYGIINGTCNFILSEMTEKELSFDEALKLAQDNGYAERDPTGDISGMDAANKLSILTFLAFGKHVPVNEIYTEGITHIAHTDIEHARSLGLSIKLLAIAKKEDGKVEARVHPTLITGDHPLAAINGVLNATYLDANLVGQTMLSGNGAGQMAAASGVISDLINLATCGSEHTLPCNRLHIDKSLKIRKIHNIETKFYLRFIVPDRPGTLSKITGVLGNNRIGINSVTQKPHIKKSTVPVIMLTDFTTERNLRKALDKIYESGLVKAKPVAIRMEKL